MSPCCDFRSSRCSLTSMWLGQRGSSRPSADIVRPLTLNFCGRRSNITVTKCIFIRNGIAINFVFHIDQVFKHLPSSDHRCNALLDGLLQADKSMPVVLPQQFLSFLVRDLRHILTNVSILPKVPAWLKLSEHC